MIVLRANELPLRTKDGGVSWHPLTSCAAIVPFIHDVQWSWTGKTLALFGNGGTQSTSHPHTAYVWRSKDDGNTWTDETADIVTNGAGISQWYEDTLFLSSAGGGLLSKVFED